VHDLVVRESLETLARDAAERLRGLLRSGEDVPFEVVGPGEGSPFAQYSPMSGRFVREHAAVLSDLDAFTGACAAIREASLAGPYLEQLSEPVPDAEDRRAEAAAVVFLSRVWEGSSDFSLEGERLPAALRELEGAAEATSDGNAEVVAPLIGFHMPTTRLALENVTLIRADVVEVPDEIRRTEGTRRGAWEPQFLAIVRGPAPAWDDPEPYPGGSDGVPPGAALRELVRALRLFKAGGVGLGPHAWARTPGDRWRRLVTGSAQPRPGGYRLTDSELGDLAALSRALAKRGAPIGGVSPEGPGPAGTFARAISRFEAGLERPALLEALSDYVLTLRYLLDGGGADVGLAMRVAALCAEPGERPAVKSEVERALALERSLMRGELPHADGTSPLALVAGLEERTRALLRDVASGRRGIDLRAAADEELLADGLSAGEGAPELRGATAEWGAIEPEQPATRDPGAEGEEGAMQEIDSERETRVVMAARKRNPSRPPEVEPDVVEQPAARKRRVERDDWLSEVDSRGTTLDWPERPEALKLLDQRPADRDRARRRVRHLFPRPETTEWGVAELQYDRRRRRARV
jgi:hypothetical protein